MFLVFVGGGGSLFSCACFFCVCVIRVEEADVDVWERCHHRTPDAWVLKAADFHPACLSHVLDSVCAQVFASDDHMRTRTCVVSLKEQSLYMSVLINSTTPVVVNDLENNKSVQSSLVSLKLKSILDKSAPHDFCSVPILEIAWPSCWPARSSSCNYYFNY